MTKQKLLIGLLAPLIVVVGGAAWLQAVPAVLPVHPPPAPAAALALAPAPTPTVGAPKATPSIITVNTPTTITVTVQITDSTLLPGGVNLLRFLNASGTQSTILGVMHDDGLSGDAVTNDKIFTLRLVFNEPTLGQIQAQVSAAFKGQLKRIVSPTIQVNVVAVITPQQSLSLLADNIELGNLDAAAEGFSESAINRQVLSSLTANQRKRLADGFRNATLVAVRGNSQTYEVAGVIDGVPPRKMTLAKTETGQWIVISW